MRDYIYRALEENQEDQDPRHDILRKGCRLVFKRQIHNLVLHIISHNSRLTHNTSEVGTNFDPYTAEGVQIYLDITETFREFENDVLSLINDSVIEPIPETVAEFQEFKVTFIQNLVQHQRFIASKDRLVIRLLNFSGGILHFPSNLVNILKLTMDNTFDDYLSLKTQLNIPTEDDEDDGEDGEDGEDEEDEEDGEDENSGPSEPPPLSPPPSGERKRSHAVLQGG